MICKPNYFTSDILDILFSQINDQQLELRKMHTAKLLTIITHSRANGNFGKIEKRVASQLYKKCMCHLIKLCAW